jgi:polysaccharide pyruvyl transferase WcaK-like protein
MSCKDQMRISVLGATFETENMGVSALAAGTIKCILSEYPSATVTLLDYAKKPSVYTLKLADRNATIPLVNMRFSKRLYLPNNIAWLLLAAVVLKLVPSRKLREWVVAKNVCLRHIKEATIVASMAGGDSFSDIYGLERLLYVALPQVLVLLLGKPLLLLPQTIGPFRARFSRMMARYILRHALRVYTRDFRSLKEVEAVLGHRPDPERFKFCYDVGFILDPIAPTHQNVVGLALERPMRSTLVGLNISGLLFMGGYTRNNAFGLRVDYQALIYNLIDFLVSKKSASVLLVPHVFGTRADSESDSQVCEQVFAALEGKYRGRIGLVRGTYNQSEIKHIIGLCDFFIGSRMHACIAAVSQTIPAVSIAYSDKFLGVMETVGVGSLVADARKLDTEEILNVIGESYDSRALSCLHLETKMAQIKGSVLNLFSGVPVVAETLVIGN